MSTKKSEAQQMDKSGPQPAPGEQPTTHIPAWKILLAFGILLGLMIVGGFLMKN